MYHLIYTVYQVQGRVCTSSSCGHRIPQWSVCSVHQTPGDQDGSGGRSQGDWHRDQQTTGAGEQLDPALQVRSHQIVSVCFSTNSACRLFFCFHFYLLSLEVGLKGGGLCEGRIAAKKNKDENVQLHADQSCQNRRSLHQCQCQDKY